MGEYENIVITGNNGLLSKELQKLDLNINGLFSNDFDITKEDIKLKLKSLNPDTIIHSAAITNSHNVDLNPILAIKTNIIGTAFLSEYCIENNKRLIYISTDYIYPGIDGDYKETDPILPNNNYAWTKLGGECSVKLTPNHLIIRTSFGASEFPYPQAWTNQIVSKDYVDIIAPMILKVTKSNITGILNIGTNPKTMFEYASKRSDVLPIKKSTTNDFSLNINKYEQLFFN
jgi:dTDP-4-dehydrorhamnose reductase